MDIVTYALCRGQGGGSSNPSAKDVSYDNTESGLVAENVQDAIDILITATGIPHINLTETQYAALTTEQKMNGTIYFVSSDADNWFETYKNNELLYKIKPYGFSDTFEASIVDQVTTAPQVYTTYDAGASDNPVIVFEVEIDGTKYYLNKMYELGGQFYLINYANFVPVSDAPQTIEDIIFTVGEDFYHNTGLILKTTEGGVWNYDFNELAEEAMDPIYNSPADWPDDGEQTVPSGAGNRIYRYDIIYSSTDNIHIDLTQEQYNALTPTQKNNGAEYFITDAVAEGDFSNIETRLHKMENNFITVSPNLEIANPASYVSMTKVDANTVTMTVHDDIADKDYLITVIAQGTGNTRYNPSYTITEIVNNG